VRVIGRHDVRWRVFDLAVLALAVFLAWPSPSRQRVWEPPESVDIVFPGGRTMSNAMQSHAGRILSRERSMLVFRWLPDPVAVTIEEPVGGFELILGVPGQSGAALTWDGSELLLALAGAGPLSVPLEAGLPRWLRLEHAEGAYRVTGDGRELLPPVDGPAPPAPAAVALSAGTWLAGVRCRTAAGETRHVHPPLQPTGLALGLWAVGCAILFLAWWHAWRPRARPPARPGSHPLVRVAGFAVGLVLVAGLPLGLERRNAARMTAQLPCETESFAAAGPFELLPGAPLDLDARRDGDFELTATVVLDEGAALDLLLRAELPRIDRQVLVTLSADPALPSGLSVNLGTSLETRPAPARDRRLPAGRPLRVEVTCRDERSEAAVDGRPLGVVRDFDLRSGRTAFHALAGRAVVSDVRLRPLGPPRPLTATLRSWQGAAAGASAAALALLWWGSRRRACGWLWAWPMAALMLPVAPDGLLLAAIGATALTLVLEAALGGRHGAGWRRRALMVAAGATLIAVCVRAQAEQPSEITPALLNALRPADVSGAPVPPSYAWARHPLCRRFNGYLKTQTFRDERVPLQAPAGSLRVAALGSSSTFGYGVDAAQAWPAQLQAVLRRRLPGREVVVVNAGVPGGTAERLRPFLEQVVLGLRPDAVVIDLGFNDHSYGGAVDERAHFETMTTSGIGPAQAWWAGVLDRRRLRRHSAFVGAQLRGDATDTDVRELLQEPAERFGVSLRELVAACRAAGAEVLLVQEPMRPSEALGNLAAYHSAMAEVARVAGVDLISPQERLEALGDAAFLDIVHPRAAGHAVIAGEVAEALLRSEAIAR
jgi:lysophospholipase L1-like esterase